MAKKTMKWTLDEGILTCEHTDGDFSQPFDLTELWPDFGDWNEVQSKAGAYGIKQKLADHCAQSADAKYTPEERRDRMADLWARLTDPKDPQWNVKGEGRTSKIDKAMTTANKAELKTMLKLGLIAQAKYDEAIKNLS